jgi:hypothetical protein
MTKLVFLLVAFAAMGCGDPNGFDVDGFTAAEVVQIQLAATEWCGATNGKRCAYMQGGASKISIVDSIDIDVVGRSDVSSDGTSEILIKNRRDRSNWLTEDLRMIARHELGHHFGCRFELGDGHAIAFRGHESRDITNEDIACARGE